MIIMITSWLSVVNFYRFKPLHILLFVVFALFACKQKQTPVPGKMHVPSGYEVEVVTGPGLVDFPMFCILDETGRLFVFESTGNVYDKSEDAISNPQFRIKLLEDKNDDGIYDKSTVFADKIGFPQGGVFYKGSLYASSAPDLLKLTDTNGDGIADKREVILTGWGLNVNANSLIGPFMGPDGWLYMTSAIMGFDVTTKEGKRLKGETSRIWRVRPDGSGLEWVAAGGMNNPVELAFTEAAELIGTETYFTNPKAGQRDALVYWTEGGVYPKPNSNIDRDSLVRTGELMPVVSKYSRVAPSGICRYRGSVFGDDFKDNLFSAQFNTHKVIRHKLYRDGASFKTEDEVFFSVQDEDFHPTDVLEDADGSLLIVETGGWFIKGCPLSQVSKPELKGAIYRVRKKGSEKIDDPYGNKIKWDELQPADACKYLEDARPFVCDRAQQSLIDKGHDAINALKNSLVNTGPGNIHTRAVFALYRIGTNEALELIRNYGLVDTSAQVRIAAAKCLGLAKDKQAVEKLKQLVLTGEAPVRRQAATALGQIGDNQAVNALLASAETASRDKFIKHALIYALVSINEPAAIRAGLKNNSPFVKEAALIALDQARPSALNANDIKEFLVGEDSLLRNTAIWVASHHQDWSGEMITFLNERFNKGNLEKNEEKLFTELLVSFCENPDMQRFIAKRMKNSSNEYKLFFLHAMGKCRIKEFPGEWIEQVGQELLSPGLALKAGAMELVGLRGITSLSQKLKQVIADKSNPASLRIDAIAALLKQDSVFRTADFDYLYELIEPGKEAPVRQEAIYVLGKGKLSESQLQKLAFEYLPVADAFILPRVVPLFAGAHSSPVGKALVSALINSPALDGFTKERLEKTFEKYPADVKPEVDKLMQKLNKVRAKRLERLQVFESQIGNGVLDRGRQLFFGKATCSHCHSIGAQGGNFGPDLTSIQRDRSAHDLLEAVIYPGASFVREFETYKLKTKTGEYRGILKERAPDAITLEISPGNFMRISNNEIIATEIQDESMMPNGFDKLLSAQEIADLMAFLLGQEQNPVTDQGILRH